MASSRPLAVIDAEITLARVAIGVCDSLTRTALTERRYLLEAGWSHSHVMCEELDAIAQRWTVIGEALRLALGRLTDEAARN